MLASSNLDCAEFTVAGLVRANRRRARVIKAVQARRRRKKWLLDAALGLTVPAPARRCVLASGRAAGATSALVSMELWALSIEY